MLTKGGQFEGRIITKDDTYIIEKAVHHFGEEADFHTILYKISDVTFNSSRTSCAHEQLKEKQNKMADSTQFDGHNIHGQVHEYKKTDEESTGKYTKHVNDAKFERKIRNKRAVDPTKTICELYMQV